MLWRRAGCALPPITTPLCRDATSAHLQALDAACGCELALQAAHVLQSSVGCHQLMPAVSAINPVHHAPLAGCIVEKGMQEITASRISSCSYPLRGFPAFQAFGSKNTQLHTSPQL